MPRSPTGNSSIPITFTPNTPAKATEVNADFTDVAAQLTDSLSRSGKGGMQAALDMGGYKVQNTGAPAASGDVVTKGYADATYATSVTLADYVLKATPAMTGNPTITNAQPGIQLVETDQSNKNWYILGTAASFVITETDTATTRLSIAPGGVVNIPGSLTLGTKLAVAQGGTGAPDAAGARTNLGLGTLATQNANAVAIAGGSISGTLNIDVTGNIEASGIVTSGQVFLSSAASAILATTGAGTVFLRPNGFASTSGQATLNNAGTFSAPLLQSTGQVLSGGGTGALGTDGNVIGAIWLTFGGGFNDAFNSINARIESRANAYASIAQSNAIAAIMPTVAAANLNAIGSTIMASLTGAGEATPGSVTAGSTLNFSNAAGTGGGNVGGGSWMCMGYVPSGGSGSARVSCWKRLS
jgi:hypothetical protein